MHHPHPRVERPLDRRVERPLDRRVERPLDRRVDRRADRTSHTRRISSGACVVLLATAVVAQTQFRDRARTPLPAGTNPTFAMAVGDVNGDRFPDLVLGNMGGTQPGVQNSLYLGDGLGGFTEVTATQLPQVVNWTGAVALGDIDGDGDLDIFFGNTSSQPSQLLLNDGTGRFTDVSARLPQPGITVYCAGFADLDFDGDLDLVMGGHIRLNDGKGNFTDVSATHSVNSAITPWGMSIGDVDGDGDPDLMFGNTGGASPMLLWLNNGLGGFTDGSANLPPIAVDVNGGFALGDVDGDGDLDVFVQSYFRQSQLWLNDGKGVFTDVTGQSLPTATGDGYSSTLADVDGDGDLDAILFGGANLAAQSKLLLNDGTGKFTDGTARLPTVNLQTATGAVADFDLDGDLDIYMTNWGGQDQLWTNFQRQIDIQNQPTVGGSLAIDYTSRPGYLQTPGVAVNAVALSLLQPRVQLPGLGWLAIGTFVTLPGVNLNPPGGAMTMTINLPNDPSLKNLQFYLQSVIISTGPGARDDLTNCFAETIK